MTRKRFIKLTMTLCEKIWVKEGKHLSGENLKYYRDITLAKMTGQYSSYTEAWECFKAIRDIVGM